MELEKKTNKMLILSLKLHNESNLAKGHVPTLH